MTANDMRKIRVGIGVMYPPGVLTDEDYEEIKRIYADDPDISVLALRRPESADNEMTGWSMIMFSVSLVGAMVLIEDADLELLDKQSCIYVQKGLL